MNEDKRNITVTEIKWDVYCPTVSYREFTGTQVKEVDGLSMTQAAPEPEFVMAAKRLEKDFLQMMQLNILDGEMLAERVDFTGLKADNLERIVVKCELSFDKAKPKEYCTPAYDLLDLPENIQKDIKCILKEAADWVQGKTAQTVLDFNGAQDSTTDGEGKRGKTA